MSNRHSNKYIGAHVSFTRNDPAATATIIKDIGAEAAAIFLKPKLAGAVSKLPIETVRDFNNSITPLIPQRHLVVAHGGYIINLAGDDEAKYKRSMETLKCELDIGEQLGVDIVIHPGYNKDKSKGINQIAQSINKLARDYTSTKILLETMSGKPTSTMLCSNFEEIAAIINKLEDKSKIGVCIDTCHLFVSGYDIRTDRKFDAVMREFDRIIGPQYLRAVHVNDSTYDLGSGRDTHKIIGKGKIGIEAFKFMMADPHFDNIPLVIERGGTTAEIKAEIEILRSL